VRIAHISDLHLLSLEGAVPRRLFNKRITGYANLKLRRGSVHKPFAARAVAAKIRADGYDHVVITGDMTNLALEQEFEVVLRFLEEDLALPPDRVSVVPGNHDAYTRGAYRSRRFQHYLADYMTNDLPEAAGSPQIGAFPYVRLRGPVAIIGVSSAVPRPPLIAAGYLGTAQRMALRSMLEHAEVKQRMVVLLQHHPWKNPARRVKALMEGLRDADEVQAAVASIEGGLALHGHLHRRIRGTVGRLEMIGSTSASLLHDDPDRVAGFNGYEIDDNGVITSIHAKRLDPANGKFTPTPIPVATWN
jgi:3',5'-cyclic AMP phosphodiesterase CpdA